jgi:hypothetical protein
MAGGAAGLQQYLAAAAAAAAGGGGLNNALLGQVRLQVNSVAVISTMLALNSSWLCYSDCDIASFFRPD